MSAPVLPRYDPAREYAWNYAHAPDLVPAGAMPDATEPAVPGAWRFCGRQVASPLGIAAGPLLNGRWVLYYAALGFDVLTYKTVRSRQRDCYPLPNLQPVACGQLFGGEPYVTAADTMRGSWAVSFGMPSMAPDVWRADIEATRRKLPPQKLLNVSVVGTMQDGWTLDDLAEDYATCARWAMESGADTVEANFSCPNVCTRDGDLYQDPPAASLVAQRVRDAIGGTPLVVKIGHLRNEEAATALIDALAPWINALAMTNSVATQVRDAHGRVLFDGQRRGICGAATLEASLRQVAMFSSVLRARSAANASCPRLEIIGIGGVRSASDVRRYLAAGADSVQLATAVMVNPAVGIKIRRDLART